MVLKSLHTIKIKNFLCFLINFIKILLIKIYILNTCKFMTDSCQCMAKTTTML